MKGGKQLREAGELTSRFRGSEFQSFRPCTSGAHRRSASPL